MIEREVFLPERQHALHRCAALVPTQGVRLREDINLARLNAHAPWRLHHGPPIKRERLDRATIDGIQTLRRPKGQH